MLYGVAGTGKTEFARSLIKSTGKDAFLVKSGEEEDNRNKRNEYGENMVFALKVAVNTVDPEKGVLIMDEADYILNTMPSFFGMSSPREKGWLNSFLETSNAKIIWISNRTVNMEESTQRRFSYSVKFNEYTPLEREMVFKNILKKHLLNEIIKPAAVCSISQES